MAIPAENGVDYMVLRLGHGGVEHAPVADSFKTHKPFLDTKLSLVLVELVHVVFKHAVFEARYFHFYALRPTGSAHAGTIKWDTIRANVASAED